MFKKLILSFVGLLTISAVASASVTDGCYQTYQPGSMNLIICISGSIEEGIGGSNARVAFVGPNGGNVVFCQKTSGIVIGVNNTTFQFKNDVPVLFTPFPTAKSAAAEGQVSIGSINLKYMKLREKNTDYLMNKIAASSVCK